MPYRYWQSALMYFQYGTNAEVFSKLLDWQDARRGSTLAVCMERSRERCTVCCTTEHMGIKFRSWTWQRRSQIISIHNRNSLMLHVGAYKRLEGDPNELTPCPQALSTQHMMLPRQPSAIHADSYKITHLQLFRSVCRRWIFKYVAIGLLQKPSTTFERA